VESLHLSLAMGMIFAQCFRDGSSPTKQMSEGQGHLEGGNHAVFDFPENLPSPFIATTGSPRGKKNALRESCAR
jgi:hypothetical protein